MQQHTAGSPKSPVPPIGKENPAGTGSTLPSPSKMGRFVGAPTLILHHGDCRESSGANTQNLTVTEKRGGACNNQHVDLGRLSSYLQCPGSDPQPAALLTCRAPRARSDQGTWRGADLPDSDPQTRSFAALEPGLPVPKRGAESQSHPLWTVSSSLI